MTTAEALRLLWLALSIGGALYFGGLLASALGDLNLRRRYPAVPRSAVLLAWHRVTLDAVLLLEMLIDAGLALLAMAGEGALVIYGLLLTKALVVALAFYLRWNRDATKEAATIELGELEAHRLVTEAERATAEAAARTEGQAEGRQQAADDAGPVEVTIVDTAVPVTIVDKEQ